MYSKDLLKQQIEKKVFGVLDVSKSIRVNRQVVYLKDVLGLLADYRCIPTKQLEEFDFNKWVKENTDITSPSALANCSVALKLFVKKELLEESK